jgi:hypothetical protein
LVAEQTIGTPAPDLNFELTEPKEEQENWYFFNSRDPDDLLQLTRHFNGIAYIKPEIAVEKLLDLTEPTKACRFFENEGVSPLLDEVLQESIEQEIKKNPPPRFLQLMQPQKP